MAQIGVFQVVKDFFSRDCRPVTMDELKRLTKEDREELADAIATQSGLVKFPQPDGSFKYGPPS